MMGCSLHYLLLWERPELLIALFPMMCANTHFRRVPAYVEEVQSGFKRGCIKAQCHPNTKGTEPEETMIYLKAQSN